jgi:hypothetical protein
MKKLIITLSTIALIAGETLGQNVKEPYYMIGFSVVRCRFEIQINKVSLITMNINGQMSTRVPCNYLILESGKQQLDIIVHPSVGDSEFGENSAFSAKIVLYEVSNEFTLVADSIVTCEMGAEDKTEAVYRHTTYFNADVPYRITAWQNSADLNTVENLREKLISAYKKIGEMITQKQYDTFRNSLRERESNMAVSMFLDKAQSKARMDGLIEDFQNGFEMLPLSGKETVRLYADGKLACLVTEDGEHALQFRNSETEEEMTLDMMFHLKKGDTELSVAP